MAALAVMATGLLWAAQGAWSASVTVTGTTLYYKSGPNESNDVRVTLTDGVFTVTDEGVVALQNNGAGAGCASATPNSVTCPAAQGTSSIDLIQVNVGNMDDRVAIDAPTNALLYGREGNDVLSGGSGTDLLNGFTGNDRLLTRDGVADQVFCGEGTDSYDSDPNDLLSACEDNGVPPETTIDSGPPPALNPAGAPVRFTFSATESPATFICRLDQQVFPGCSSPFETGTLLAEGTYTFGVTAADQYGNSDPTEAARSFKVDLTSPNTSITAGPSGTIDNRTPTFELSSSEAPPNFVCEIDDGPIIACQSSFTLPALENGSHTFRAWAQDAAGNLDQTGASRTFTVSASGPVSKAESPPVVIVLGSIVLISGRTVKMSRSGTVPVSLVCAGARICKGTMQLTTADPVRASAKQILKLGKRRFRIKPQHKASIKIKLGKKRMRTVRRLHRVKARATIREVDLRGNPRISMRTFTLRG